MRHISLIVKVVLKLCCVLLLCIMVWQQWTTFLKYQEKFVSPVQFTKQIYGNDYITTYGKHFEEIKKMFSTPTCLNYFGEANDDFGDSEAHYALTQYFLTPNLILRNKIGCDTIIYNLHASIHLDPATNFHLNTGWHVVKDFNNGLIVLAK